MQVALSQTESGFDVILHGPGVNYKEKKRWTKYPPPLLFILHQNFFALSEHRIEISIPLSCPLLTPVLEMLVIKSGMWQLLVKAIKCH